MSSIACTQINSIQHDTSQLLYKEANKTHSHIL